MSMRRLTANLKRRVEESEARIETRLRVHEERRESARVLTKQDYRLLLQSKAMESASRPSARPQVTLTPEMAMAIAEHLK